MCIQARIFNMMYAIVSDVGVQCNELPAHDSQGSATSWIDPTRLLVSIRGALRDTGPPNTLD